MEIAAATMAEADCIADLWVDLARDQRPHGSHLLAAPNRTTVRESVARHIVTDGLLVARDDADADAVVGFVMFGPDTGGYEVDGSRGLIENIYVVPSARGQGIGSDLLAAAETRLFAEGVDRVGLEVLAANEAAQRFYASHGYTPHRVELEKGPKNDTH